MKSLKEDFSLMSSLLIPVAVAINFTGFTIAKMLNVPLFLDSIGTVFISLLAGPWVGSVAAIITSVITGGLAPENLAFIPVGILIAVVMGTLTRFKMKNYIVKIVVCTLILAIVSISSSTLITILMYGGITPNATGVLTSFFVKQGISLKVAATLSNFISEIGDKVITVVIAMLIVKSMSDRYLIKFKHGENYIHGTK